MSRRDRATLALGIVVAIGLVVVPLAHRLTKADAGPAASAQPGPSIVVAADGSTTWDASAMGSRNRFFETLEYGCPPNGVLGQVWGTDLYTDDSSICTAGVHRGVISREAGGSVSIAIRPGAASYVGSTRSGVTTDPYGPWAGSFEVVGPTSPERAADRRTVPPEPPPPPGRYIDPSWIAHAVDHRGENGTSLTYECSSNGTYGPVWGSGPYTDDTSVCTAGVHAGVITREDGGSVTIVIRPGELQYRSATRHGVTPESFGPWEGSFEVVVP